MGAFRVRRGIGLGVLCAGLVAAACLAGAIYLGTRTCGCATPATMPPWPVSVAAARTAAASFAAGDAANLSLSWWEQARSRLYTFDDGDKWIAVDGDGAGVAAALYKNEMPASADGAVSADQATSEAAGFLATHSIAIDGLSPQTTRETHGPVADLEVRWHGADGTIVVGVNASSGHVFWFFDGRRSSLDLPTPAIGPEPARALALAAEPADATVEKESLLFEPGPGASAQFRWRFIASWVRNSGLDKGYESLEVDSSTGDVTRPG